MPSAKQSLRAASRTAVLSFSLRFLGSRWIRVAGLNIVNYISRARGLGQGAMATRRRLVAAAGPDRQSRIARVAWVGCGPPAEEEHRPFPALDPPGEPAVGA